MWPSALVPTLALAAALALPASRQGGEEPEARRLARELTETARLAGTVGSWTGARRVARELERAGWEVELEPLEVRLTYPRRLELALYESRSAREPFHQRSERFDPDAIPPGDVPPYNAWSKSGQVRASVIDAGYGLREDFQRLVDAGVAVAGKIALVRYGRSYRGVKVELAAEFGCSGVLLFSDPADDGAERGPVWPDGPWKPEWAVQRGSIGRMARTPGDPATPGWASPVAGEPPLRAPLEGDALQAELPAIPCLPIPASEARAIRARLAAPAPVEGSDGVEAAAGPPVGPGPVQARIELDQPIEARTIVNVVARLPGSGPELVIAGNHRDAWVRGAHDAASGTVALVRAAQHLGERARAGWTPRATILLAFWDAEEFGLIGSTEWAEARAEHLREHLVAYVNADAAVSGPLFRASGTPGLLGALRRALERLPRPAEAVRLIDSTPLPRDPGLEDRDASSEGPGGDGAGGDSLWDQWSERFDGGRPELALPGSGSDFAVFLHHLSLPVIDLGFDGAGGGQYHTAFDDFPVVDRFLDPDWSGHELAGRAVAEILAELAGAPREAFDEAEAARALADVARQAAAEDPPWLGVARGERLAGAFEALAEAVDAAGRGEAPEPGFYAALSAPEGLEGRPWFVQRLWAPGLETGYRSETFPGLRTAAGRGEDALERELASLMASVEARAAAWEAHRDP